MVSNMQTAGGSSNGVNMGTTGTSGSPSSSGSTNGPAGGIHVHTIKVETLEATSTESL